MISNHTAVDISVKPVGWSLFFWSFLQVYSVNGWPLNTTVTVGGTLRFFIETWTQIHGTLSPNLTLFIKQGQNKHRRRNECQQQLHYKNTKIFSQGHCKLSTIQGCFLTKRLEYLLLWTARPELCCCQIFTQPFQRIWC